VETLSSVEQLFGRPIRANDVVAVVTLYGGGPTWSKCIESLVINTHESVPLVIFEDHGPSESALAEAEAICHKHGKKVWLYRQISNLGVVGNLNSAFDFLNPADVIVLNSDIIVGPGWSTRLTAAARCRTDIATATALSSNGTIFTVPAPASWKAEVPSIEEFAKVSNLVGENSILIRPTVPVATSFCTFFSRKALNIVGKLDMIFSPGYGEEVDYSLRCGAMGFTNVAADDVYVFHATGESFGETEINPRKLANDRLVSKMHTFWDDWIHEFQLDSLNALNVVRVHTSAVINGLNILIDADLIDPNYTGTYEGAIALTESLTGHSKVSSVTWVSEDSRASKLSELARTKFANRIKVVPLSKLDLMPKFDVALRPSQDYGSRSWPIVRLHAHRNVVWHLDTISTNTPKYHKNFHDFQATTWAARSSWQAADAIAVLTEHVAQSVSSSFDLSVHTKNIRVIPNGSPKPGTTPRQKLTKTSRCAELSGAQYVLVLGTSFAHKNRLWMLRLFEMAVAKGFKGKLVFAGPHPTTGSSLAAENDFLSQHPSVSERLLDLGRVEDDERDFLLDNATLVVSPTLTEGFGMTPFEATKFSTPVLSTVGGGLRDIAPKDARFLTLQDDKADVETLLGLLNDKTLQEIQIDMWRKAMQKFSWEHTSALFVNLFFQVLAQPSQVSLNWRLQAYSRHRQPLSSTVFHFFMTVALKILGTNTKRRHFASKIYNKIWS
jgi:glycosyltransferase involved in cell wall biosynthesis